VGARGTGEEWGVAGGKEKKKILRPVSPRMQAIDANAERLASKVALALGEIFSLREGGET